MNQNLSTSKPQLQKRISCSSDSEIEIIDETDSGTAGCEAIDFLERHINRDAIVIVTTPESAHEIAVSIEPKCVIGQTVAILLEEQEQGFKVKNKEILIEPAPKSTLGKCFSSTSLKLSLPDSKVKPKGAPLEEVPDPTSLITAKFRDKGMRDMVGIK